MARIILGRALHVTNPLLRGADVTAVQRLLTAKGFPVEDDGWFGPLTAAACVSAKKRLKYPLSDRVPSCGQQLVDALEAHAPFPLPPLPRPRVRYVAQLRDALTKHSNWDYSQTRPIPHRGHQGRVVTDCSGGVTYLAECAGCPDPNGKVAGREFSGYGWTGTILDHCSQIVRAALRPGDLVVFGRYPGHHVCAVLTAGDDPMLWSHGRQGDPREISLSNEAASQARNGHSQVTYLRFLP